LKILLLPFSVVDVGLPNNPPTLGLLSSPVDLENKLVVLLVVNLLLPENNDCVVFPPNNPVTVGFKIGGLLLNNPVPLVLLVLFENKFENKLEGVLLCSYLTYLVYTFSSKSFLTDKILKKIH
jgi:hypothetical protein